MNTVNLIGNLVADPELKGQNNNVVNFVIAVQRPFKTNKLTNMKQTSFVVLHLVRLLKSSLITLIKVIKLALLVQYKPVVMKIIKDRKCLLQTSQSTI